MNTQKDEAIKTITAPIQKEWLSPKEVSNDYGMSISSLAKFRMQKKYLKFSKVGKYIKYKRSDIIEFLEAHTIETVS